MCFSVWILDIADHKFPWKSWNPSLLITAPDWANKCVNRIRGHVRRDRRDEMISAAVVASDRALCVTPTRCPGSNSSFFVRAQLFMSRGECTSQKWSDYFIKMSQADDKMLFNVIFVKIWHCSLMRRAAINRWSAGVRRLARRALNSLLR